MTREEIKIAALRDREIKIAASNYVEENSVNGYEAISSHRDSFIEGAKWADMHPVNVWHDASEEPQGKYEIIYQDEFNHVWLATYRKNIEQYKNWWEECVACNYIVRWAYISDLLPKGGEK